MKLKKYLNFSGILLLTISALTCISCYANKSMEQKIFINKSVKNAEVDIILTGMLMDDTKKILHRHGMKLTPPCKTVEYNIKGKYDVFSLKDIRLTNNKPDIHNGIFELVFSSGVLRVIAVYYDEKSENIDVIKRPIDKSLCINKIILENGYVKIPPSCSGPGTSSQ